MNDNYTKIREAIRTHIVYLETKFTQEVIAKLLSTQTNILFYAKDINLLKNLKNSRWKGKAKKEKLDFCLSGLKQIWDIQNQGIKDEATVSPENTAKIQTLIETALQAEIGLYKSVPKVENSLEALENLMCKNGNAYQNLYKIIQRVLSRTWTMKDLHNPSYCELLDFTIERKKGNRVFVKTMEHWFLKWFSATTGELAYIYENTNEQLYIVEYREDKWIIISNIYSSPNSTAPPVGEFTNHYLIPVENKKD